MREILPNDTCVQCGVLYGGHQHDCPEAEVVPIRERDHRHLVAACIAFALAAAFAALVIGEIRYGLGGPLNF